MNSFDVSELREHIEDLKEKIEIMERLQRSTDKVMYLQGEQIKVQKRIIDYLENWIENNAPTFDFREFEKFKLN